MSNYADNKLIVNSAFGIFDTFSFTSFINLLPHKDDIDFHDESVGAVLSSVRNKMLIKVYDANC